VGEPLLRFLASVIREVVDERACLRRLLSVLDVEDLEVRCVEQLLRGDELDAA